MQDSSSKRLILASASPRRKQLLQEYGYDVETITPPLAEPDLDAIRETSAALPYGSSETHRSPSAIAQAIGSFKAKSVADRLVSGIVLAGDTVVAHEDRLFGKPTDRAHATAILRTLQGTTHQVITGVALVDAKSGRRRLEHASTAVTMKSIAKADLQRYLNSGLWMGKAGAYGIQERDDPFVARIDGSFTNVVGLPMELITSMLADWGFRPTRKAAKNASLS